MQIWLFLVCYVRFLLFNDKLMQHSALPFLQYESKEPYKSRMTQDMSFSSDGVGCNFTINLSHWATLQPGVTGGECKTKLYNDGDYSHIKEMSHFTCLQLCVQWFTFNFVNCWFSIYLFFFPLNLIWLFEWFKRTVKSTWTYAIIRGVQETAVYSGRALLQNIHTQPSSYAALFSSLTTI